MDPIVHEDFFIPKFYSNDIALLKLAESVDLKTYTPACLPAVNTDYVNQNGYSYGEIFHCLHLKGSHNQKEKNCFIRLLLV